MEACHEIIYGTFRAVNAIHVPPSSLQEEPRAARKHTSAGMTYEELTAFVAMTVEEVHARKWDTINPGTAG